MPISIDTGAIIMALLVHVTIQGVMMKVLLTAVEKLATAVEELKPYLIRAEEARRYGQ